ncbi:DUF6514 family protein [Ruminococcus sp.]|uniref:DUF6514 family protein n=1 Tax=Ruminococcus sp. TaxID=41978 RepID=UPI0025D9D640|nr:DUF6514 family protein [Ruminococcus sp.]MDD6989931.1 DUF6514 family protein [Ruminococcus sp.]MDY6202262.1 DUF6514 family protein [Ruminococcus sp.]
MVEYKFNCIEYCSVNHYGIDVFSRGKLVKSIDRITNNYNDIILLVNMCNELEIELCHIDDIVEDYLTDFCV